MSLLDVFHSVATAFRRMPELVADAVSRLIDVPVVCRVLEHQPSYAFSKSPESAESARAAHSLDNPATLPVEFGLPARF